MSTAVKVALGVFIGGTLLVAACSALVAGGGRGDDNRDPVRGIEPSALYNSVAVTFTRRYKRATGTKAKLSRIGGMYCEDARSGFTCELRPKLLFGVEELWAYAVRPNPETGCWRARTLERFGPYQEDVDAYRNRDSLAPSKGSVRRMVQEAERLRTLSGCIPRDAQPRPEDTTTEVIARFASQGVQREFPGRQQGTTCRSKGKYTGLGPDSYQFSCETRLASGRRYAHSISCFDPPPYSSFEPCTEEEGYPRKPPRPLP